MTLLWTKNSTPMSKLIRWMTGSDCSHFAVMFDRRLVFHSTLAGVHPILVDDFLESNEIVHEIDFSSRLEVEEAIYRSIVNIRNSQYDILLFFQIGIRLMKYKLTGFLETSDIQNDPMRFICTELAQCLSPALIIPESIKYLVPHNLYDYIYGRING